MNLQNEKITISYCESVKKRGHFLDLVEVQLDELTAQELEQAKNNDRWLFDRIIKECLRLAESVIGIVYYEVNIFYEEYNKEEEDYITTKEKTFGYYVADRFICNSEDLYDIKNEFEEKAQENFCKAHNINYEEAKEEYFMLDYIEEKAEKKGVLFASVEINNIYDSYVENLINEMYIRFVRDLKNDF